MSNRMKPLKLGAIVFARRYVPGYPMGILTETRLVVRERKLFRGNLNNRYRVERDDGRPGSWWLSPEDMREQGEP